MQSSGGNIYVLVSAIPDAARNCSDPRSFRSAALVASLFVALSCTMNVPDNITITATKGHQIQHSTFTFTTNMQSDASLRPDRCAININNSWTNHSRSARLCKSSILCLLSGHSSIYYQDDFACRQNHDVFNTRSSK